jgi:nitroreductase
METWDAMQSRRNVRVYEDRPLEEGALTRILEAGRRSPSALNRQKWDFIVSTDPAQLQDLTTVWIGAAHVAGSAATVALVLPQPEDENYRIVDRYDLGQVTMAMAIAAADLGIGSGHSAVGDQEACRRILGIPETHLAANLLAFGYPADRPLSPIRRPDRRPLEDVVHWGKW